MNQRAVELYQQALQFAYTTIGKDHADTSYFQGAVAGRFAESIVGECIKILADNSEFSGCVIIVKHFRVDE